MARNATLAEVLRAFRAEARLSLSDAQNIQARDTHVGVLQRTQEWLWQDFDWPHLLVERKYPVQAGLRYYDFTADFDVERIRHIQFKSGGIWRDLDKGIGEEQYAAYDSDLDSRTSLVTRWRIAEDDQVEIWPICDLDGDASNQENYLKVIGIRKLKPFVADNDRADLDKSMIALYAAAEQLGGRGSKDGQLKLSLAQNRHKRLRADLSKRQSVQMFGIGEDAMPRKSFITRYRPPGS